MSKSQQAIRVLVVDDHDMVRRGLSVFLQAYQDLILAGEASNGLEAISFCKEHQPDVVLMDMVMPEMNGIAAIRAIGRDFPEIHIIAITSFDDEHLVKEALEAGAISYLHKNVTIEEMYDAIRKACAGQPTLSPEATRALINSSVRSEIKRVLTTREAQILDLMVSGFSNPEIAQRLMIGRSTVKTHVSNILAKLEVSRRTEAIAIAVEQQFSSRSKS